MIIELLLKDYANIYNGDFNALFDSSESLAEAIVDWVDQSGNEYCKRFDIVKNLFPNFSY
jgi:hypothetical protein